MSVTRKLAQRREEAGAVAIAYALIVLLLLGIAALGTDLGNAISRRTSTQSQADFAAYDAAQLLTTSARAGMTPTAATVNRVRDTLNDNQPQSDGNGCANTNPPTCVTSAMLTDGNLANSEVRFTSQGLQVISPPARVQFGFAAIFGATERLVDSAATVNVFSPGKRVLPMFAVSGCDWGRQTLADPAGGAASGTPNLIPADNGGGTNLSLVKIIDPSGTEVATIPKNGAGYKVWVSATNWNNVRQLGYFFPDVTSTNLNEPMQSPTTGAALTPPYNNNGLAIQLQVPANVTATEGVWYIKGLSGNGAGKWSPNSEALAVRVGQSLLECGAGSTSGNFGTMRLPRNDVTSANEIPMNIAKGFQDPLNLVPHAWGVSQMSNSAWNGECTNGVNEAVVSTDGAHLKDDTNCVDMDPGLPANVATEGFVTGVKQGATLLAPGLLIKPTVCNRNGGTSGRTISISPSSYTINDDVLSCFLTGGKSLADISSPSYSGGPALTAAVLSSPRFAYVPIVARQPANGSSNTYSIVGFRPAFITDEQATSGAVVGSQTGTADNGIVVQGNDVKQIKVVFFNIDALPRDGDVPVIEYLGIGRPIVHMVD